MGKENEPLSHDAPIEIDYDNPFVTVSERNIKEGEPCKSGSCPIALAIVDLGAARVAVGETYCRVAWTMDDFWKGNWTHYALPLEARDFITRFDGVKTGKPEIKIAPIAFKMKRIV